MTHTASFRFAFLYAALFVASAIVLGITLYVDAQQSLETLMRDRIRAEVQQLMVDYRQDGMEELRHDIRERIEANPTNRLRYQISNADGRHIFDKLPFSSKEHGWHYRKQLVLYTQPLDGSYILTIGGELSAIHDMQHVILHSMGVSMLLATILALAGSFIISRRFLKRVDDLRQTAELVGTGDLSQRIPMHGSNDEFDQLANIINQMLNRIEILVQEIQNVTTNIAHDLRTPLTQLRNQLEAKPDHDDVILTLDHVIGTFNSLLRIAEIESGVRRKDFTSIQLSKLIHELTESYTAVAEERGVQIHSNILPSISISGDRHLIIQMMANLIENALKYGGHTITISLTKEAISIHDNGSGIPEIEFASVVKPFYRLDKSRSSKGSGLGLSLVAAIARFHSMHLSFKNAQPGLTISIALPQATLTESNNLLER